MTNRFVRVSHDWIDANLRNRSGSEVAVWLVLERYASPKTRKCYPSEELIADKAGVGLRTVKRVIARFRRMRWIEIKTEPCKTGRRNVYRLLV